MIIKCLTSISSGSLGVAQLPLIFPLGNDKEKEDMAMKSNKRKLITFIFALVTLFASTLSHVEGQILLTKPLEVTQRLEDGRVITQTLNETYSTMSGENGFILKIQDSAKPFTIKKTFTPSKIDGKWPDAGLTEVNVISCSSVRIELGVGTKLQILREASGDLTTLYGYPGSQVRLQPGVRLPWKDMELWVDGNKPAFFLVGLKQDDAVISEIEAGRRLRFLRKNAKGNVEEGVFMQTREGVVEKVDGPAIKKKTGTSKKNLKNKKS
jgi:hypothetical protein